MINNLGVGSGEWYRPGQREPRAGGVTLVELLVVLVLLGVIFGMTGLALASLSAPRQSVIFRRLQAARAEAIRTGRPVQVSGDSGSVGTYFPLPPSPLPVLFLPDGRAIGPGIDPLTGAPRE